ncbi:synaptobrevin-domain-containing protein [Lyophyllum atratum]|nr:synaptobrevin-domain-containing protein [Lyophyllum atratum]
MPFSLHGTPYDPPAPTIAPAPATAPVIVIAPPPPQDDDNSDTSLTNVHLSPNPKAHRDRDGDGDGDGSARPPRSASARRPVSALQLELDETFAIMSSNLQSMAERGERLESLESRTENLVHSARVFRKSAHKVRKDMWWKDMKMRLIIGLAITVVIALTVLSIVQAVRRGQHKTQVKRDVGTGGAWVQRVARGVEEGVGGEVGEVVM